MSDEASYVAGLGKSTRVEIGYWVSLGKKVRSGTLLPSGP
jgi:hypothetical protein